MLYYYKVFTKLDDEGFCPSDVDYAVVGSLELAQACRAELEALGFEVAICGCDEPAPEVDVEPRLKQIDLIPTQSSVSNWSAEERNYKDLLERRRQRFEKSVENLTDAARQTVIRIGQNNGWSLRDACPNLIVESDHEGGAILIVFDEFGRTEWLIDPDGSDLLFSRTRRPSTKFFKW